MKILIINNSISRWTLADSYGHAFQSLNHETRLLNLFYEAGREQSRSQGQKPTEVRILTETVLRKVSRVIWGVKGEARRRLLMKIREWKPELVMVVGNVEIDPDILKEIKKILISCRIFWYLTDPLPTQNSLLVDSVPFYDCILTFSKFQVPLIYWFGGKNVFYLPFGYDPRLHRKVILTNEEKKFYGSDVAYLGTWQPTIENWLNELTSHDLKVWGNQWHQLKGCPQIMKCWQGEGAGLYGDLAKVANASKVIFNVVRFHNGNGHSMKTFEIPASGGFMLTNRTDEQVSFFPEDTCAVYFSTQEELKDKLKFYLLHETERERISQAGYEVAQQHHYNERARTILSYDKRIAKCGS